MTKRCQKSAKLLTRLGICSGIILLIVCFICVFIGYSMPIAIIDALVVTAFLTVSVIFNGLYLMDY